MTISVLDVGGLKNMSITCPLNHFRRPDRVRTTHVSDASMHMRALWSAQVNNMAVGARLCKSPLNNVVSKKEKSHVFIVKTHIFTFPPGRTSMSGQWVTGWSHNGNDFPIMIQNDKKMPDRNKEFKTSAAATRAWWNIQVRCCHISFFLGAF